MRIDVYNECSYTYLAGASQERMVGGSWLGAPWLAQSAATHHTLKAAQWRSK